jgi:hypothetical protein
VTSFFRAWYSRHMAGGRALLAAGVVGSSLLGLSDARAQSAPPPAKIPLALKYAAPSNCPTANEFRARVEARTELAAFSDELDGAEVVRVTIRATGSSYAGHLFMAPVVGATSSRDVQDLHCTDVADALALVTALAIDPDAALSPSSTPPPPPPPPPGPEPPPLPPHVEPPDVVVVTPAPPSDPQKTPDVHLLFAPPGDEPRARRPHVPLVWHWNAGAEGAIESGVAPDAMVGGAVFGELAASGEGVLVPSARVSVLVVANGAFEPRTAAVTLVTARLTGCPVRFGGERFSLSPCGAVEAGDLLVEGEGGGSVARPLSVGGPWVALDLLARVRWQPWQRHVFLEVEGGPTFPLTRPTFVYDLPSQHTVSRASAVAPFVSIGAGLRFR